MRQIVSSGSVKALFINRNEVIDLIKKASTEAQRTFPEIHSVWLFGSFAKNETTGTSDIDILIIADTTIHNPVERIKPYYFFFSEYLPIAFDIIVIPPNEKALYSDLLLQAMQVA